MRRFFRRTAAFILLGSLGGCGGGAADGPVTVSVIGPSPAIVDPSRKPPSAPSAMLLAATAQGLVRFDATGEIEPGLAIRWAVSDDGLYYTFRLATGIDADNVARRLRAALGPISRNPLKPLFGAVDEIVAVTPEVIEIRLVSPQPNLLELLAQPELTLPEGGAGSGPFRVTRHSGPSLVLGQLARPEGEEDAARDVSLRGERAALAVARFAAGKSDLVLGGSFADLAIARAARPPAAALRFDPADGLLGLAVVQRTGFLGSPDNRRALALAIDRAGIAAAFPDSGWRASETLLPPGTIGAGPAVPPDWADLSPAIRHQIAAGSVQLWAARDGAPPRLRVAMPPGPGARLLFALLARGWRSIGVDVQSVPLDAPADLRLIDAVAPSESAAWYLHLFSCPANPVCSDAADEALRAADKAATVGERAARLAEANAALAATMAFLPIAQPLRWSLVAPRLDGFQPNPRAVHPLNHLLLRKR